MTDQSGVSESAVNDRYRAETEAEVRGWHEFVEICAPWSPRNTLSRAIRPIRTGPFAMSSSTSARGLRRPGSSLSGSVLARIPAMTSTGWPSTPSSSLRCGISRGRSPGSRPAPAGQGWWGSGTSWLRRTKKPRGGSAFTPATTTASTWLDFGNGVPKLDPPTRPRSVTTHSDANIGTRSVVATSGQPAAARSEAWVRPGSADARPSATSRGGGRRCC